MATRGFIAIKEDGKYKYITSIDINKLEQKVKAKGLKWRKIL